MTWCCSTRCYRRRTAPRSRRSGRSGIRRCSVTCATASCWTVCCTGVDVVCHQAAVVGHGVDPSDAPEYAAHNDYGTAVLLAAMHRAGLGRLVLASRWSSTARAATAAQSTVSCRPPPRRQADVDAGRYEPALPVLRRATWSGGWCRRTRRWSPAATYAATKLAQEHLAAAWARRPAAACWALRYHNVYGPRMPQDTPYAGRGVDLPLGAGSGRGAAGDGGRPAAAGLRARHRRRAGQRPRRWSAPEARPGGHVHAAQRLLRRDPHTVGELATQLAGRDGRRRRRRSSGARGRATSGTSSPTRRGRRELLGFQARVGFSAGVADFANAPLRDPVQH